MPRGVKDDRWTAEVLRQRTYRRAKGVETYALRFTYRQDDTYIHVAFRGQEPHDVINVRDYETDKVAVTSKRDVKALVNEYMKGMDAEELRKRFEDSKHVAVIVR